MPTKYKTREEWLVAAAALIKKQVLTKEVINNVDDQHTKFPKIRFSCGFTGSRSGNQAIGVCWYPEGSSDKTTEIFISPVMDNAVPTKDNAQSVLDVLIHEMIHAIRPTAGHGAAFKRIALAAGLAGKMTATHAGDELIPTLKKIAKELGKYPHAKLHAGKIVGKPKQGTRLIGAKCPEGDCDGAGNAYTIRLTRKWIETAGMPTCPVHHHELVQQS